MYINDIPFFHSGSGGSGGFSEDDKENIIETIKKVSDDRIKQLIEHNTTALEIPDGTTEISDYQFQNNENLRRVVAPNSLTKIGISSFQNCFRMTGIDGLGGLKEIGNNAFNRCTSLTDIEFPETLKTIGVNAFQDCFSLRNKDLIAPNCERVLSGAFQNCNLTGKLELPNCREINVNAFTGCNFSTLILSNKLEVYGGSQHGLYTCYNLEFVELGEDFNCNGFNLSMSTKYSVETLIGILNSLKDRTGETAYTLTLGATNLAKLTDEQKKIATNKNWGLA